MDSEIIYTGEASAGQFTRHSIPLMQKVNEIYANLMRKKELIESAVLTSRTKEEYKQEKKDWYSYGF